jgi:transmembrane 9 superfamily protein 2/4
MTACILMFVFMGLLAGYCSATLYKALKGEHWRAMTLRTALLFPGVGMSV